ncbi:3-deoxy-D-manno-octulosonic-acid transferase [Dysgonomonas sp. PH5-45]|uniref:3-deoxy-D-manno-octulosonic acid transferase n=1 Tax=unclassified Dysgonomonas TaxID=2630389 RepID=UPI002473E3F6|nr:MULTISPECIES: glycosyltransferase N-terminal domain-containing protein [unclassified Dysgonomonas]MDH6355665.1 3-deoxy-D-manno-octulosonic-acid transferase [Dysgonomonas sp. PH5-45]MDH6388552.1 3-deoxy-D-manno-octulosonic-acid transferase [Dysgonomonas sp. PH5-37]
MVLYNLAIFLYSCVVRLIAPFHKKAGLMVGGHKEVLGKLRQEIDPNARYIWLHAASLGEFEQGRPIIENIRQNHPQYKILLTFFSPSGYEVRKNYELADVVCYLPFDTQKNARHFIDAVPIAKAIFIKYEFWYNYINCLHHKNIPIYMVSAIFRPTQLFFKWYGKPLRDILKMYSALCVQDENSKELLAGIGVKENVVVCGDTRFDRVLDINREARELPIVDAFTKNGDGSKWKTLVAGSSWPKDEDVFIKYFNSNTDIKLIIAPHEIHEAHLKQIESLLQRPSVRYSQATAGNIAEYDCLIIDSFGMLSSVYRYGEVAYVGGGFGVGIHNVLEAAVYGMPVVFGPNFKKFREARELIECGGAYCIRNFSEFSVLMDEFLSYPEVLASARKAAGHYVAHNAGVVEKIMQIIKL